MGESQRSMARSVKTDGHLRIAQTEHWVWSLRPVAALAANGRETSAALVGALGPRSYSYAGCRGPRSSSRSPMPCGKTVTAPLMTIVINKTSRAYSMNRPGFVEARLLGSGPGGDRRYRVVLGRDAGQQLASNSAGGTSPISPWTRLWLNQSTYSATAILTSPTDFQPPWGRMTGLRMHSALNSE
jgi:hypothetical protein